MSVIYCEICSALFDTDFWEAECEENEDGEMEHYKL